MSRVLRRTVLASLLAAALAVMPAWGEEDPSANLVISAPWIRKPPPGVDTAALYFTVQNNTGQPVGIRVVKSPVAAHAMIHETSLVDGQSRMRMKDRVVVPLGGRLVFAPEGLHVMLSGLNRTLEVGEKVPVTFEVGHTGVLELVATVRPLDAK